LQGKTPKPSGSGQMPQERKASLEAERLLLKIGDNFKKSDKWT